MKTLKLFKNVALIFAMFCFINNSNAHDVNYDNHHVKHWTFLKSDKVAEGSFYMYKNGNVYIEVINNKVVNFPLTSLSLDDQSYVFKKQKNIVELNKQIANNISNENLVFADSKVLVLIGMLLILVIVAFSLINKTKFKYIVPIIAFGTVITLFSFNKHLLKLLSVNTNPSTIDSAFTPFKPNVNTFWNSTYFYVESIGVPTTHTMMVGISNNGWQQQVPVSQCYLGTNAWPIPLNPVVAATPVPVNATHFTRGAIAVAVNGIAIFNPYTNTGVDAFLDGQLDNYGGHCGRADDYHYHTAPLHLYNYTSGTLPIAYALDGFAVYGAIEPDGSAMQTLDSNHGHYWTNGVYHYHGSAAAPYMIAKMVGQITEDATNQIIPQAVAQPIRPSLTPLNGALITSCTPNTSHNGYNVTYTLAGQIDSIVYNWSATGLYTYKYYHNGVLDSTKTYNKPAPCVMPNNSAGIRGNFIAEDMLTIYPNPTSDFLNLKLNGNLQEKNLQDISIYNLKGELVFKTTDYKTKIDIRNLSKGSYIVKVTFPKSQIIKKIALQ